MPAASNYDEEKVQALLKKEKKERNPILDWLVSVGILVAIVAGCFFLLKGQEFTDNLATKAFTWQGLIVLVAIVMGVGTIQYIVHLRHIAKIRAELKAKMLQQWGRKD